MTHHAPSPSSLKPGSENDPINGAYASRLDDWIGLSNILLWVQGHTQAGNVYVTGRSTGRETKSDYATVKYNSFGILQWTARYNGIGNSEDDPIRVATDQSGNVFVMGKSGSEIAAVKYNPSGILLWVARYNSPF